MQLCKHFTADVCKGELDDFLLEFGNREPERIGPVPIAESVQSKKQDPRILALVH